jgi:predicted glutamine amidotransferase
MCRVLGCVAREKVSLRWELLEAPNPIIRQSEDHDSGWGMAVYPRGEGEEARCLRFPDAAHTAAEFEEATSRRGRIAHVHVRRATIGGLTSENTHPFCLGNYSFSHNGTILEYPRLMENGVQPPKGTTDSEMLFNLIISHFDPEDAVASLRRAIQLAIERTTFSGLNFLFSDGEYLYAYRLGVFELHWVRRSDRLLVSSERLDEEEGWHDVRQDVLLVCNPLDWEEPHAERLVGDTVVARARIDPLDEGKELRGAARGEFAAQRAARLASTASE